MNMGNNTASEIFQYLFQAIVLINLIGTRNISDHIVFGGTTIEEHDKRIHAVLKRLETLGTTLNFEKSYIRKNYFLWTQHGVSLT